MTIIAGGDAREKEVRASVAGIRTPKWRHYLMERIGRAETSCCRDNITVKAA
jgi:hypothetical protein